MFFFKRKEESNTDQEVKGAEMVFPEEPSLPAATEIQGVCEVVCPVCKAEILPASAYCGCCGADLSKYQGLQPASTLVDPEETISICPFCGASVPAKYTFCQKCGKRINIWEGENVLYNKTVLIAEAFEAHGLKHSVEETPVFSYLEAGFSGKNITGVKVRFVSVDEESEVKVITDGFAKYPEDRKDKGYCVMNRMNDKFKYAKFVLNDRGDVHAEYDIPRSVSDENLGEIAVEIALRFASIIDNAYPEIMQSIWG